MNSTEAAQRRPGDVAAHGRRGTLFMVGSRVSGMAVGLVSSALMGWLLSPGGYGLTAAVIQREGLAAQGLVAVFWLMGRARPVAMRGQWQAVRPGLVSAACVVALGLGVRQWLWPAQTLLALPLGMALALAGAGLAALIDPAVRQLWAQIRQDLHHTLARRRAAPAA